MSSELYFMTIVSVNQRLFNRQRFIIYCMIPCTGEESIHQTYELDIMREVLAGCLFDSCCYVMQLVFDQETVLIGYACDVTELSSALLTSFRSAHSSIPAFLPACL